MAVYVSNIVIEQGFTFNNTFEFESINTNAELDLVGYGVTAQLRKNYSSSNAVSFACTIVGGSTGKIKISLTDEQTAQLKPGRYVYDVAIQDGGFSSENDKQKVVEGMALVRAGVTK
jgi:hypothetical protein